MTTPEKDSPSTATNHKRKRPLSKQDDNIPLRNIEKLYCSPVTLACALEHSCVPCGYKIGTFDIALDTDFCQLVPNQRPESCVRSNNNNTTIQKDYSLGYRPGMSILTVGDGDFSFSLAVARLLQTNHNHKLQLIATSYEREETLNKVYPNYDATVQELKSLGAKLYFEVDATNLSNTLPSTLLPTSNQGPLFDRICWNFPCTAVEEGQDGQNSAMESNKQLVRKFVQNAIPFLLKKGGEIHMCHKTKPPFNQWQLEQVAVELCPKEVQYCGRIVFDRCLLPPYKPRKALHSKSFPCHDACTYIFQGKNGTGEGATIPAETEEDDKEEALVPVTSDLIWKIRTRLLEQAAQKRAQKNSSGRKKRKWKR